MAIAGAVLLYPATGRPQVRKVGDEFLVNSYTTGAQVEPVVATRGDDEFIVLWSGGNPVHSLLLGVRAQQFDRTGEVLGSEFLVSAQATSDDNGEMLAAIATRSDGSFVVAWASYYSPDSSDIVTQRFDQGGGAIGDPIQANTGADKNMLPAVATDEAGRFVVAWTDRGNLEEYRAVTRVRSFGADGTPVAPDVAIATNPGISPSARVAMRSGTGESLVVWSQSGGDDDGFVWGGPLIAPPGALTGTEFQVNAYVTSYQGRPDIAAQRDGFVVVWHSFGKDGHGFGISGQRLAVDGSRVGSEFQVNQYTTYDQALPSVAVDGQGNFVVVWESYDTPSGGPLGQDGDGRGIFGRAFDQDAQPLGAEFQVNTYTTGNQGYTRLPEADVAMFPDGDFVVVWNSPGQDGWGTGIFGQRFHLDAALGPLCGDAAGNDLALSVTDALAVLYTAVGLSPCAACVCDANGSGTVTALDALIVLGAALDLPTALACPACS